MVGIYTEFNILWGLFLGFFRFSIRGGVTGSNIFICLVVIVLLTAGSQPVQARSAPFDILVINSYHQGLKWEHDLFRGIQEVLEPRKNNIRIHVENMDTKRVPYTPAYREKLLSLYHYKYRATSFRLIIATDNNAFDLMRQYRDTIFPGVPVAFCGVNFFQDKSLNGLSGFTGVAETIDAAETVRTALELHPETRHIFVVNDHLPTGRAWTHAIRQALQTLPGLPEVSYAGDLSMDSLLNTVQHLPEQSIVLLGVYFRDKQNRFYTPVESTSLITRASRVPVYGLLDFTLGSGIVGGKMMSGYLQGKSVAEIAVRILAGTDPAQIPVLRNPPGQYMFDHNQLEKWQISERQLPDGSVIINQPASFYRQHKRLFWQISGFFSLMGAAIIALILAVNRKNRAEKRLKQLQVTLEQKVENRTRELHKAMSFAEQTSRKLMLTTAELQSILDHSPIGIIFTNRHRHIKQVNAEMITITGFKSEEMIGRTGEQFFLSKTEYEEFSKQAYPTLMDHKVYETKKKFRIKSGQELWCHLRGRLIFHGDKTQGIIWTVRDISQLVAAEKKQQATARKLEQAQRYKSLNVMAGAIAHHFNNIMTAVQGNIELLLMGLPRTSKPYQLASNALESAHKASQISTSMLTYVGQRKMMPQVLDLCELINGAGELLRNNVRPQTEMETVQHHCPLFCLMDPAQITEVVLNLVINADESIKADRGQIRIKTHSASIDKLEHPTPFRDVKLDPGQYACCEISDNGSGIDSNVTDHIFDPFFSTKFTGRGLGLSIAAGIIKAHNGTMQVRTTPGQGSCISIYIPSVPPPDAGTPERKRQESAISGQAMPRFSGTVILADDNLQAGQIGKKLLEELGFDVALASDGQEAVDLFQHYRESVVITLLDAVMPNKSGVDALEEIKGIDPSAKVILVSGYSQDQITLKNTDARPDIFVQKPYRLKKLATVVTTVLGKDASPPDMA